tara:strand:- start:327 stop:743 length:417 start_codon:yes stop_codon:yes gene_type:complete
MSLLYLLQILHNYNFIYLSKNKSYNFKIDYMIISKTPYRISFFGGGTDYPTWYLKNGGSVLSTTIDKYIYISCRNLPPFFKHKYRIVWSHIELPKKIDQIKHNSVREMLNYLNLNKVWKFTMMVTYRQEAVWDQVQFL